PARLDGLVRAEFAGHSSSASARPSHGRSDTSSHPACPANLRRQALAGLAIPDIGLVSVGGSLGSNPVETVERGYRQSRAVCCAARNCGASVAGKSGGRPPPSPALYSSPRARSNPRLPATSDRLGKLSLS